MHRNTAPTIAFVLRSGGDFTPEHVQHLYGGISHWWPESSTTRFVLFTDLPLSPEWSDQEVRPLTRPSLLRWWSKMEMFAPEHADLGTILYFDLDTVIVGPLDDIIECATNTTAPVLVQDFYRARAINSGMMALPVEARMQLWDDWLHEPKGSPRSHKRGGGDGDLLDSYWRASASRWQGVVPGQVVSYKVHCKRIRSAPPDARVVCFHGRPRPWKVPELWNA